MEIGTGKWKIKKGKEMEYPKSKTKK